VRWRSELRQPVPKISASSGRVENIVVHQPLVDRAPAKPRFDFGPAHFVACPHDRDSPDSFTRPRIGEALDAPKKFQNRNQKMSLFRRQAMSGPKGENARSDNNLPTSVGSPKIADPDFFFVAV
jgi:hypothetical protein